MTNTGSERSRVSTVWISPGAADCSGCGLLAVCAQCVHGRLSAADIAVAVSEPALSGVLLLPGDNSTPRLPACSEPGCLSEGKRDSPGIFYPSVERHAQGVINQWYGVSMVIGLGHAAPPNCDWLPNECLPYVVLMLAHRRRRWANIKTALD